MSQSTLIKKSQVEPNLNVEIVHDGTRGLTTEFWLDGYRILFNEGERLMKGEQLKILSKPRQKQHVKLVRVQKMSDNKEGEVFYTDLVNRCKVIP